MNKNQPMAEMDAICPCCAGLYVHKKTVVACIRKVDATGKVRKEVRSCALNG